MASEPQLLYIFCYGFHPLAKELWKLALSLPFASPRKGKDFWQNCRRVTFRRIGGVSVLTSTDISGACTSCWPPSPTPYELQKWSSLSKMRGWTGKNKGGSGFIRFNVRFRSPGLRAESCQISWLLLTFMIDVCAFKIICRAFLCSWNYYIILYYISTAAWRLGRGWLALAVKTSILRNVTQSLGTGGQLWHGTESWISDCQLLKKGSAPWS